MRSRLTRTEPATLRAATSEPPSWNLWIALGLFSGWIVLGTIGPLFELAPQVRAWYPPAALLAAAVTIWGARALVPIMLAATITAVFGAPDSEPLWRVLTVSALLKVTYWAASTALRRFGFNRAFSRPIDVVTFAAVFSVAAAVSGLIAVTDLRLLSARGAIDTALLVRSFWVGDMVAVFALAPAMIILADWLPRSRGDVARMARSLDLSRRNLAQAASIPVALLLATVLSPAVGFFAYTLCFIPLGWIALVHGPRVAALANVASVVGALASVHSLTSDAPQSLTVQAFTIMLVLTGLTIGSVADEREHAFAMLGESEAQYRRLVELLPDPVLVHVGGRIVFANTAAARVHGSGTPAALTGMRLLDLAAPQSRELSAERLKALAEGKVLNLARHTVRRVDGGGTVEVESTSIPFNFQGKDAVLTVARDVTIRTRLEDQLRHAQRMEAVGRLAGGVAHDFNNLLTVITSYSELILAGLDTDVPLAHDVREIHHAANRAASLTRQLLTFSRRQVLQPAPMDVSDTVRLTQVMLRRLIGPEIEIVAHLDAAAGIVLADKGQFEQVIVNLAVNARDAMPNGGTLTLETRSVLAADDEATARCAIRAERYAVLVVRDTGVGIDARTLTQIFDPFFTTKEVGQGTGLGLATAHGIVEQSGGTVVVRSTLGAGTEFRILLPNVASEPEPVEAPPVSATESLRGKGRVLLVEDDANVRAIVIRTLRGVGYEVTEAADGVDAMSFLEARDPGVDVVISDVAMPKMDGRQLALLVRERWPDVPLVMMSGYANPELFTDISPGLTLLLKPFRAADLLAAVEEALGSARRVAKEEVRF